MLSASQIKVIRSLTQKKERDASGLFVAEGSKCVNELLQYFDCRLLVLSKEDKTHYSGNIEETLYASPKEIERASFQKTPQGVIAVFKKPETPLPKINNKELYLALDGIQNPGNLGTIIRLADWFGIRHIFCSPNTTDAFGPKTVQATMQFVNTALVNYKDDQLEKEYPDFGNLMREYHDGILLFNISNEKVWDKATRDTKGLEAFFRANRRNYTWSEPRFKGFVISCKNEATRAKTMEIIAKVSKDSIETALSARLNRDTVLVARIEKGLFVQGDNKAVDKFEFKTGDFTPSKAFPIVFTYGKMLKTGPESYADVMGILTSDYQTYLENQWVRELQREYPVIVDQKTLNTIKEN